MQKIIQIYPCLFKLSRKQESVTDGQLAAITISPHRYHRGIKRGWGLNQLLGSKPSFLHLKSGLNRKQCVYSILLMIIEHRRKISRKTLINQDYKLVLQ
jgi:hypothetical protein